MASLKESYLITSDDGTSSVAVSKDGPGNLLILLEDSDGAIGLEIPEELLSSFTYAVNRIT